MLAPDHCPPNELVEESRPRTDPMLAKSIEALRRRKMGWPLYGLWRPLLTRAEPSVGSRDIARILILKRTVRCVNNLVYGMLPHVSRHAGTADTCPEARLTAARGSDDCATIWPGHQHGLEAELRMCIEHSLNWIGVITLAPKAQLRRRGMNPSRRNASGHLLDPTHRLDVAKLSNAAVPENA